MRKIIVGGLFLILAALILAAGSRYELVAQNVAEGGESSATVRGFVYRIDKWTGGIVSIQAGIQAIHVEKPIRNVPPKSSAYEELLKRRREDNKEGENQ